LIYSGLKLEGWPHDQNDQAKGNRLPNQNVLGGGAQDQYCYRPDYLIKNEQNLVRINGSPAQAKECPAGPGQNK
jgi:hypothetical protein